MRTPCYHPRIRLGRTAGATGCPSVNRHLNHAFGQASFLCQRIFRAIHSGATNTCAGLREGPGLGCLYLRLGLETRSRRWKHYCLGGFSPAFPRGISGIYSLLNRSAGFSNSPRQPEANAAFVAGRGALPRWLSAFRPSAWMSATTGTMIPIARRCRVPVRPGVSLALELSLLRLFPTHHPPTLPPPPTPAPSPT